MDIKGLRDHVVETDTLNFLWAIYFFKQFYRLRHRKLISSKYGWLASHDHSHMVLVFGDPFHGMLFLVLQCRIALGWDSDIFGCDKIPPCLAGTGRLRSGTWR
jgi:hypothetical protein